MLWVHHGTEAFELEELGARITCCHSRKWPRQAQARSSVSQSSTSRYYIELLLRTDSCIEEAAIRDQLPAEMTISTKQKIRHSAHMLREGNAVML